MIMFPRGEAGGSHAAGSSDDFAPDSETDAADPTETVSTERFRLVPSVEPGVVFASLAEQCVPDLCDDCTIDVVDRVDGTDARYRIAYPPGADAGGVQRIAARAATTPAHRLRVRFDHPPPDDLPAGGDTGFDSPDGFRGRAVFVWHRRPPTRTDRTLATTLVSEAVRTVLWQRTEQAARVATADAAQLKIALRTSRDIGAAVGILMSRHKLTQDQAFELLRSASQHSNRKLRDLALDVLETGRLEPALIRGSTAVLVGGPVASSSHPPKRP